MKLAPKPMENHQPRIVAKIEILCLLFDLNIFLFFGLGRLHTYDGEIEAGNQERET